MSREAYFILLEQVRVPKEGKEIDSSELFKRLNPQLFEEDIGRKVVLNAHTSKSNNHNK